MSFQWLVGCMRARRPRPRGGPAAAFPGTHYLSLRFCARGRRWQSSKPLGSLELTLGPVNRRCAHRTSHRARPGQPQTKWSRSDPSHGPHTQGGGTKKKVKREGEQEAPTGTHRRTPSVSPLRREELHFRLPFFFYDAAGRRLANCGLPSKSVTTQGLVHGTPPRSVSTHTHPAFGPCHAPVDAAKLPCPAHECQHARLQERLSNAPSSYTCVSKFIHMRLQNVVNHSPTPPHPPHPPSHTTQRRNDYHHGHGACLAPPRSIASPSSGETPRGHQGRTQTRALST